MLKTAIALTDGPIVNVTILSDNICTVTRQMEIKPTQAGVQMFIIEGVTQKADINSIHVAGIGPCTILEVSSEIGTRARSELKQSDETKKEIDILLSDLKDLQVH